MTEASSCRNQFIDLLSKSMDWFLYDRDLRHEKVNVIINLKLFIFHFTFKAN